MNFGLALPTGGVCGDPRTLAEFANLAEESGWDGVFIEDYIIYQAKQDLPACDPWVALAAIALSTRRVRLGTMVTPLSRRRPWKVARETVSLDYLSEGRLILGVGVGDAGEPGFTRVGEELNVRRRGEILDEALDVLALCWSGQPFHYDGKVYHIEEMVLLPPPLQQPRIPVWVGGAYPHQKAVQRAARWDGAVFYKEPGDQGWRDFTPHDIRELRAAIESQRTSSAPFDIVVGGRERGDPEQDRALIHSLAEAGITWWTEWVAPASAESMRAAIRRGPLL